LCTWFKRSISDFSDPKLEKKLREFARSIFGVSPTHCLLLINTFKGIAEKKQEGEGDSGKFPHVKWSKHVKDLEFSDQNYKLINRTSLSLLSFLFLLLPFPPSLRLSFPPSLLPSLLPSFPPPSLFSLPSSNAPQ
jgi:hypothetical protein